MEGSRYNLIKQVADRMIIYNTLSGAVIKLDKENENLYLDKKFEQIKYLKELRDFRTIIDNLGNEEKEIIQLKNRSISNFVQVTIDGSKETHDARRPLIGQSSFDLIINNVSKYIDCLPFQLRDNIDQTNLSDIENLIEYLSKIPGFKEKSCIHFAKVVGDNSVCYTNREFAYKYSECCQFLKKYGFINSVKNLVPQVVAVQCPSLTKHHLLLDANGDIYNCWQVVGEVKYRIGTVFNGFTQPECELVETEQEKCLHCKVYPICHTGCPLHYDELLENNCKYIPELLIKDIEEYIVSEK